VAEQGSFRAYRLPADWRLAIFAALAYFILATASISLTSDGKSIATLWLANAVIVAMLVPIPPRRWPLFLVAGFVGNWVANVLTRGSLVAPILYGISNLGEVALAAALLRYRSKDEGVLADMSSVIWFVMCAGIVAPLISACGGATIAWYFYGENFSSSYLTWFVSDALGLLVFTPLFLGFRSGDLVRWYDELRFRSKIEALGLFAACAVVTFIAFWEVRAPLLFLTIAPILATTIRLGRFGTKVSITVVALIGAACTVLGRGPIAVRYSDPADQIHFFQFYLATLLLTTLPVSAELNAKRTLSRQLKEREAALRLLASGSGDALVRLDVLGLCRDASDATLALLGLAAEDLEGHSLTSIAVKEDRAALSDALDQAAGAPSATICCEFRPDHQPDLWMECAIKALVNEEDATSGAVVAIRDVTERKQRELSFTYAASVDSLTGALGRAAFLERLDARLAQLSDAPLTLMLIDVDLFKQINDTYGHPAGDAVLREIVVRLRGCLRESDVIGRLGGDEFALLLDGVNGPVAEDLCRDHQMLIASRPIEVRPGQYQSVAISCGIAEAMAGMTRDGLILQADDALYAAKRRRSVRTATL
jgi:diguanylate cyclase (GGDEF)-like protein/PAS domain S-box-containing protein